MDASLIDIILSLITLTILEIILGIDNLIFLSIVSQRLPVHQQKIARRLGLILALVLRLLLLASAVWIVKMSTPLISLFGYQFSGRDIFLLGGGIFLLVKATQEIHLEIDIEAEEKEAKPKTRNFAWIIFQIGLLDIVFSLDSILTAIGLTDRYWLMATAILISITCMLLLTEKLSRFIELNPTIKMLALSFLILIGMVLIADGFHFHIPRGYVYFAMGFSLFIEMLNIIRRKRRKKSKTNIKPV